MTAYAERRFRKLPKDAQIAVTHRLDWLRQNADVVSHEKMTGAAEYSLHVGTYRVLYVPNFHQQVILFTDLGKHDEVYRRLRRR